MARRRTLALSAVALALIATTIVACSPKKLVLGNLPPETTLFVQGPVDTVNHVVHLYWFGSDPDGEVARFEVRFFNPAAPADTAWRTTTRSDSLFTVLTPNGLTRPRFEVRAIDDRGVADPTPSTADFTFTNSPPDVALSGFPRPLPDTTFASATVNWTATDPDGDGRLMTFRLWLDGDSLEAHVLPPGTRSFTIPSEAFQDPGGGYTTRRRTVFLQGLDDGGMASQPVSFEWWVKAPVTGPVAKLLLVDDLPSGAEQTVVDRFYRTAAASVAPDAFTVLDLARLRPFRSAKDVAQTLKLFRAVVWYRDTYRDSVSTIFPNYREGFEEYLDSGGRLYISGPRLIAGQNASGGFPESFASEYLGSDFLYKSKITGEADSTVTWDAVPGTVLESSAYDDSLRSGGNWPGMRGFAVRDTNWIAFSALSGALSPSNPFPIPVGVRVPQKNNGKAIFLSFPLPGMGGYSGSAARVMQKILTELGVHDP